ncbi:hypothetical protein GCM10027445_61670 [Amycolatopsis endophytica]|uniref:DUF3558 domain-containing protein n=1 Tax=Amycolatopsis endophytica TaxID=860233 RepID=A0A853B4G1_9PSEU|nr:DUF3558 domain-containing protein [Amycolatopsis endophytica]NYI89684.1 hypothetical protein [Amycolatopsis endophytica]
MVRAVGLLACAVAVVAISGCASTVNGSPSPDPQAAAPSGSADLGALDACTILNQLLTGQGFDPGERKTVRNECVATKIDSGARGIALDPAQGLAEYPAQVPGAVPVEVNGRKALQGAPTGDSSCEVALAVGENARALVTAVISGTAHAQVCAAAQELAADLEPLLPGS